MTLSSAAASVLAASDSQNIGPGWWGFIVFVALAVAVYVLYRSMTKHMRRVPKKFDEDNHQPPRT